MKTITVQFDTSAKQYSYLSDDDTIKVNDLVAVESTYKPFGIAVAQVLSIDEGKLAKAKKYIIQKIDFAGYQEKVAKLEQLKKLEDQLDLLIANQQKLQIYKVFAQSNPAIASILSELEQLQK